MLRRFSLLTIAITIWSLGVAIPTLASARTHATSNTARVSHSSGIAAGSFIFGVDNLVKSGSGGGDTYYSYLAAGTYKGGLQGSYTDWGTIAVHKNGKFTGWGTELCPSCTLGGTNGGYTSDFYFTGGPNESISSGTTTFTQGYGALVGLTGGGTFGSTVKSSHYSYKYKL